MEKKKKSKLGEGYNPDIKQQRSEKYKNVSDTTMIPAEKKAGYGKVGGYSTFGESKTKSLGRAMQENATAVAADELARKMTEQMIERAKKRREPKK